MANYTTSTYSNSALYCRGTANSYHPQITIPTTSAGYFSSTRLPGMINTRREKMPHEKMLSLIRQQQQAAGVCISSEPRLSARDALFQSAYKIGHGLSGLVSQGFNALHHGLNNLIPQFPGAQAAETHLAEACVASTRESATVADLVQFIYDSGIAKYFAPPSVYHSPFNASLTNLGEVVVLFENYKKDYYDAVPQIIRDKVLQEFAGSYDVIMTTDTNLEDRKGCSAYVAADKCIDISDYCGEDELVAKIVASLNRGDRKFLKLSDEREPWAVISVADNQQAFKWVLIAREASKLKQNYEVDRELERLYAQGERQRGNLQVPAVRMDCVPPNEALIRARILIGVGFAAGAALSCFLVCKFLRPQEEQQKKETVVTQIEESSEDENEKSREVHENPEGENRDSNPPSINFTQTAKVRMQTDEEFSSSDKKLKNPISPDGESEESLDILPHSGVEKQSSDNSDDANNS